MHVDEAIFLKQVEAIHKDVASIVEVDVFTHNFMSVDGVHAEQNDLLKLILVIGQLVWVKVVQRVGDGVEQVHHDLCELFKVRLKGERLKELDCLNYLINNVDLHEVLNEILFA